VDPAGGEAVHLFPFGHTADEHAVRNLAQQGFLGRRIKSEAGGRGGAWCLEPSEKSEQECQTTLGNLHLAIRASEVEPINRAHRIRPSGRALLQPHRPAAHA